MNVNTSIAKSHTVSQIATPPNTLKKSSEYMNIWWTDKAKFKDLFIYSAVTKKLSCLKVKQNLAWKKNLDKRTFVGCCVEHFTH